MATFSVMVALRAERVCNQNTASATMSVSTREILKLYKTLLRCGNRFSDYNFREYTIRRTRDAFRANRNETNPQTIRDLYYEGVNTLAVVKRQTAISQMFKANPVVIEQPR
eukprot:TRINITY_DN41018_c0_g1_i1.p1 TRINITY_DN41018_c0_g1~~TRINITY_DN41018_c0_g1_i1.p1  ORF type:complete len:111 (-),score=18.26 TRINITY_DN41018_c0_g1_i1:255-587(-)